ncbi:MAG: exosortase/archaeosortase family protein [Planctomycetaceae bacterium]|nr:exosortase/archaeosortase family protein [Planctomycetaceae bacterium]
MNSNPVDASPRGTDAAWWLAGLGLLAMVAVFFGDSIVRLATRWSNEPDYSHGFLVPPFAAYLLWYRRDMAQVGRGGGFVGLILLLLSAGFRLGAAYYAFPLADSAALLLLLPGAVLLMGGWSMLRWSWPAIAFLVFMIPLPGMVAERLSGPLQHVATVCGTYALQTLGVPAAAVGNVIHLSQEPPIMVVEACSGLRMLICFIAITVGAAFIVEWGPLERLVIVLSGIPIAVAANVIRIGSTGLVQEHFGPEMASKIFHDFAGWLMMPLACLFVAFELWLLNKTFPQAESGGPLVSMPASDKGQNLPSGRAVVVPAERKQPRR